MAYNLGTAEGRIVIDGSGAQKGFDVAKAAMSGFGAVVSAKVDQVHTMGERLIGVGAAGVAGFGMAVKAASGFEAELSAIQAVSGATSGEMGKISDLALKLGKDTVFSASEAAQAIEELVKAGVPLKDIMDGAAAATVNLAAAGGISLPEAATIASAAMNQFALSGAELPKVADLISGAANASSIDVHDFGVSLNQVGAVANIAGVSFQDTAVAIAEMGKQGIRGSDAGTSLKTMFLNLIPQTEQQINLMKQLGLISYDGTKAMQSLNNLGLHPLSSSFDDVFKAVSQYIAQTRGMKEGTQSNATATQQYMAQMGILSNQFFDQSGKMKSLRDVQGILADSTKNLTQEQKLNTFSILFGSDAIRAAAVMANAGAKGYDDLNRAMSNVTAADVAKTRMDNLKGSIEQFKGSLETAQITIGQVIIPVVRAFVDALTWLINLFNSLPKPIQDAIGVLFAIGTAFSLAAGAATLLLLWLPKVLMRMLLFKTLGTAIESIKLFWLAMRAGEGASAAFTAAGEAWVALGGRVKILYTLATAIRAVWVAMTGPVGIIIAIIAAIVAAFVYCYNHFKWFRDFVDQAWKDIVGFFKWAWGLIKEVGQAIGDWFSGPFLDFFKKIPDFFKNLWNTVINWFKELPGKLLDGLKNMGEAIGKFFSELPGKIGAVLSSFGSWIGGIFSAGWHTMVDGLSTAWDAVMNFLATLPNKILYGLAWLAGTVLRLAIDGFKGMVHGLEVAWDATYKFFTELPGKIGNWFLSLGTSVAQWAVDTWNSISTSATDAWNGLMAWLEALPARIGNWFVNLGLSIFNWAVSAWNSMMSGGQSAWTSFTTWLTSLPAAIGNWFVSLGTSIAAWATSAWNSLTTGAAAAGQAVLAWLAALPGNVAQFFSDVGTWLLQAGTDLITGLWNGIVSAWQGFWDWLKGLWDSIVQGFKDGLGISSPSTVFMELGGWLIQGLWDGITNMWNSFWGWFSTLPGAISDLFSSAGSWLVNHGMSLLQGLWNGAVNIWNSVWGWISSIPGTIQSLFSAAGSWLYDAGKALLEGLWNGIKAVGSWLYNQVMGWANNLIAGVKSLFGIASPSKVFHSIGKFLVQGLADGISVHGDMAVNEAVRMAEAITKGFHDSMPDLQAMLTANVQYLGTDLRSQLANDLAGLSATVGMGGVSGRIPPSQEVQDHAKQVVNNFNSTINNPVAEKASDSEARRLRAVSAIGAFSQ